MGGNRLYEQRGVRLVGTFTEVRCGRKQGWRAGQQWHRAGMNSVDMGWIVWTCPLPPANCPPLQKEKAASGVPDVPSFASGKLLDVDFASIGDKV